MSAKEKPRRIYETKRTPEVVEEILARLSDGEPLAAICRSADKFPHPVVWGRWIAADEQLAIAYAHARDAGSHAIAEQALELADGVAVNGESIQKAKLQIETRLKLLAKWNPKLYGEQTKTLLAGHDGGAVKTEVASASPEAMRELTEALLRQAAGAEKK